MSEKAMHVRNPLTVIAIFAGIAELSGTVTLSHIDDAHKYLFVWFIIGFPCFLAFLFFLTLNFNHRVLYAPTDFSNDNNFLQSAGEVMLVQKMKKKQGEVGAWSSVVKDGADRYSKFGACGLHAASDPTIDLLHVEGKVFGLLKKEYFLDLHKYAKLKSINDYVFDAIAFNGKNIVLVEVKFLGMEQGRMSVVMLQYCDSLNITLNKLSVEKNRIHLLVVIVTAKSANDDIRRLVNKNLRTLPFNIKAIYYDLQSMETGLLN